MHGQGQRRIQWHGCVRGVGTCTMHAHHACTVRSKACVCRACQYCSGFVHRLRSSTHRGQSTQLRTASRPGKSLAGTILLHRSVVQYRALVLPRRLSPSISRLLSFTVNTDWPWPRTLRVRVPLLKKFQAFYPAVCLRFGTWVWCNLTRQHPGFKLKSLKGAGR